MRHGDLTRVVEVSCVVVMTWAVATGCASSNSIDVTATDSTAGAESTEATVHGSRGEGWVQIDDTADSPGANDDIGPTPSTLQHEGTQNREPSEESQTRFESSDDTHSAELLRPDRLQQQAPERFRVKVVTTKGDFLIDVHREWAPIGVTRFWGLVDAGFYDGVAFFRVLEDYIVQFGIHGAPDVSRVWRSAPISDDPVSRSNRRGVISFAHGGTPDSRSTQLFINLADRNSEFLDERRYVPIGQVIEGMEVVESLYGGYGDSPPDGQGPRQDVLQRQGNPYLADYFPKLDYIKSAKILD